MTTTTETPIAALSAYPAKLALLGDIWIPPDDSVRTPAEIAAGTNSAAEYGTTAEFAAYRRALAEEERVEDERERERESADRLARELVSRGDLRDAERRAVNRNTELEKRVAEIEDVVLQLAARFAAPQGGRRWA